jgi:hypothetical protein
LTSLAENKLKDEGFLVNGTSELVPYINYSHERKDESTEFYQGEKLVKSSLVQEYEKILEYRSLYLQVRYENEADKLKAQGYQRAIDKSQPYQESWIQKMSNMIVFHADGYLYKPESVMVYGYWGREKLAEALPMDYHPDR